jgi:ribosomal protein S12
VSVTALCRCFAHAVVLRVVRKWCASAVPGHVRYQVVKVKDVSTLFGERESEWKRNASQPLAIVHPNLV